MKTKRKAWSNWKKEPVKALAFFQHAFEKKAELLSDSLPRVFITRNAYSRMYHFVDICDKEVGWLGTVEQLGHDFLIEEVFLFKQEVSYATTEITTEGLGQFAQELIEDRADAVNVLNKLCFWGHSHATMGTSPSAQDDSQMDVFRQSGQDFFIRGILNKKGRIEFTIYLYAAGLKIIDPEWSIYEPAAEDIRAEVEAEVKEKVSEKSYAYTYQVPVYNNPPYKNPDDEDISEGGYYVR